MRDAGMDITLDDVQNEFREPLYDGNVQMGHDYFGTQGDYFVLREIAEQECFDTGYIRRFQIQCGSIESDCFILLGPVIVGHGKGLVNAINMVRSNGYDYRDCLVVMTPIPDLIHYHV
jgi:hypothetical protein